MSCSSAHHANCLIDDFFMMILVNLTVITSLVEHGRVVVGVLDVDDDQTLAVFTGRPAVVNLDAEGILRQQFHVQRT